MPAHRSDDLHHSEYLQKQMQGVIDGLRERLSRLSQASLRIAGDLDLDTVLQETVDGARSLTGARYGVLALLDDVRRVEALLASGLAADELQGLQEIPDGASIFEYLGGLPEPLRVANFADHAAALGLPEFLPPVPVLAFLGRSHPPPGERTGPHLRGPGGAGPGVQPGGRGHAGHVRRPRRHGRGQRPPLPGRSEEQGPTWKPWSTRRRWAWWSSTFPPERPPT